MRMTGKEDHRKEQRRLIFAPGPWCLAARLPFYPLGSEGLLESQAEHRYIPASLTLVVANGFYHTLRSGGTSGALQPLNILAGFQGGRTPLVSGFASFVWLWHQHTQLHRLGELAGGQVGGSFREALQPEGPQPGQWSG